MDISKQRFTAGELYGLFTACAFPIHVWIILMIMRQAPAVARRTDSWDAIGMGAYALLLAFVESVLVFLVAFLVGVSLRKRMPKDKLLMRISLAALILGIWAIADRMLWVYGLMPEGIVRGVIYVGAVALLAGGLIILLRRSERAEKVTASLLGGITLLSSIYLLLDGAGLMLVFVRNVIL